MRGYRAYDDDDLRDTNPNPEAYRDAWSVRAISAWTRDLGDRQLALTPYLRRSSMAFLQHFLPGQPLETNAQTSGGAVGRLGGVDGSLSWNVGAQLEWMRGELGQHQDGPTVGSAFLVATRPPGTHYDYDVDSAMAAAFYDLTWSLSPGRTSSTACASSAWPTTTTTTPPSATPATTGPPADSAAACTRGPPAGRTRSRTSPAASGSTGTSTTGPRPTRSPAGAFGPPRPRNCTGSRAGRPSRTSTARR